MAADQRNCDIHSFSLVRARQYNEAAFSGSRSTSRERRQYVCIESTKNGIRTIRQSVNAISPSAVRMSWASKPFKGSIVHFDNRIQGDIRNRGTIAVCYRAG